jgi:hypothetical protein
LRILKGNGKIPIEVIVNPEHGWTHGLAKWQSLIESGVQAFLTDKLHTLDPQGQDFHMTPQNLNDRVQSLLMNKDVEALVIVAKDKDEGQWMSQWMGQWFTDAKPMQDL